MTVQLTSRRIGAVTEAMMPFVRFFSDSAYTRVDSADPDICDFVFGNPHNMPLPGFVSALQRATEPQNKDWFAYKMSEQGARETVAHSLRERYDIPFDEADILMTNGAFAALTVVLTTLAEAGNEVIFVSPPWFFYEALIASTGAKAVRVGIEPDTFDLDLNAIEDALSERTRAILINSPHNPTGKIYPPETLARLAEILTAASERYGHPIYLVSDEAYSHILLDGRSYTTPTAYYPHSLLVYTYGKTLLTPGQRIGYIALPPTMPERAELREALFVGQIVVGYAFPNALLQHALPDLERETIDIAHLERKRDRMIAALTEIGYTTNQPEGTFYLLARSPLADDTAFADLLAQHKVFVLPGSVAELPGYFRISLTANDEMIERSLAGFAAAMQQAMALA